MKFFGREKEVAALRQIREKAQTHAQFTVITGRRRIGKTTLVLKAYEDEPMLYFFVGRKAENQLCEEFRGEIEGKLGVRMGGNPSGFAELFEYLMDLSQQRCFTLFIDEFQNFERINPSIFSEMQKIWDLWHSRSKINLLVCGSIYTMMTRIFRDNKEPLYNRHNRFINVKPFPPSVLRQIMEYYNPAFTNDDLLCLYSITGGVAKYVQLLAEDGALSIDKMIESVISEDSVFINEGRSILIEEFGRDYDIYFSILSAIASGKCRRSEMESVIGKSLGGYLTRLEQDYEVIRKELPIGSKPLAKNALYSINDNFFTFWFRFIFKYEYMLEIGGYAQLRSLVHRDYTTFTGKMLERYFADKAVESGLYTRIGQWWDRKGENEIDLIAANDIDRTVEIAEIKRNRDNASLGVLKDKAEVMLGRIAPMFAGFKATYVVLDLSDM